MKIPILIFLIASVAFVPILSDAHQSGCHRWHSCPSDSGSYTCGDTGYCSQCPDNKYCKGGQPYTSYTPPKYDPPKEPVKVEPKPTPEIKSTIPSWIKNNAGWWADGQIDDATFVSGMKFLINEGTLKIPQTTQGTGTGSNQIPTWIKNNAGWWADGSIDDSSFVQGIQFLIKEGILKVSNDENEKINFENEYLPNEREWMTSGPFQIDRSKYAIGEKIFLVMSGLNENEKGQIAFMRPLNDTHYSVYITIPFDGSEKNEFNYYVEPQISKTKEICSVDDLTGKWAVVFRGTNYSNLYFEITNTIVPETNTEPAC